MFADGTKIYKEIKSREDCASLQEDLDSLSAWSADTGLSFNVTKYNVQTISLSEMCINFYTWKSFIKVALKGSNCRSQKSLTDQHIFAII